MGLIICKQCGKEVQYIGNAKKVFCNKECYGAWLSENKRGENANSWKGKTTDAICPICGEIFKRCSDRIKYCSKNCYKVDLKKRLSVKGVQRGKKHGLRFTRSYSIWSGMKGRATNINGRNADGYVNRGIDISDDWLEFENFYRDMGEAPEGLTIERIDNDKGYSKENCRWATPKEQSFNKRNNVVLTYNGETQSLPTWAERIGLKTELLYQRYRRGWSMEKMMTQVKQNKNRRAA